MKQRVLGLYVFVCLFVSLCVKGAFLCVCVPGAGLNVSNGCDLQTPFCNDHRSIFDHLGTKHFPVYLTNWTGRQLAQCSAT